MGDGQYDAPRLTAVDQRLKRVGLLELRNGVHALELGHAERSREAFGVDAGLLELARGEA